jgi:hypothetical protein
LLTRYLEKNVKISWCTPSNSQIDHEMWMWWVEAYKCQAQRLGLEFDDQSINQSV